MSIQAEPASGGVARGGPLPIPVVVLGVGAILLLTLAWVSWLLALGFGVELMARRQDLGRLNLEGVLVFVLLDAIVICVVAKLVQVYGVAPFRRPAR